MSGLRLPSVTNGVTASKAKANTREPGVVKTTIGLVSSDAVISPRADYGVTASKAKDNTRSNAVISPRADSEVIQ